MTRAALSPADCLPLLAAVRDPTLWLFSPDAWRDLDLGPPRPTHLHGLPVAFAPDAAGVQLLTRDQAIAAGCLK